MRNVLLTTLLLSLIAQFSAKANDNLEDLLLGHEDRCYTNAEIEQIQSLIAENPYILKIGREVKENSGVADIYQLVYVKELVAIESDCNPPVEEAAAAATPEGENPTEEAVIPVEEPEKMYTLQIKGKIVHAMYSGKCSQTAFAPYDQDGFNKGTLTEDELLCSRMWVFDANTSMAMRLDRILEKEIKTAACESFYFPEPMLFKKHNKSYDDWHSSKQE